MTDRIITHDSPDLDAIVSIWLLLRFGETRFPGIEKAKLDFVSAGVFFNKDAPENTNTIAVDILGGHFDHHGSEKSEKCSAVLVAEYLGINKEPSLEKILKCVNRVDTTGKISDGKVDPVILLFSLFDMIRGWHCLHGDSYALTVYKAMDCLDAMLASEIEWIMAMEDIESAIVVQGVSLKIIAVESKSKAIMKAARHEQGSLVIAKRSDYEIGIVATSNNSWKNPDLTPLAVLLRLTNCYLNDCSYQAEELLACGDHYGWFLHPSLEILTHGSAKAIERESVNLDLKEIATLAAVVFYVKRDFPERLLPVRARWEEINKRKKGGN